MAGELAFIVKNNINPAYGGAIIGAKRSGLQLGLNVVGMIPKKVDDPEEQAELVYKAISQRVDAIILLPAHEIRLNDAISAAESQRIPVFVVVSKPSADSWVTYIGSEHVKLAYDIASYLLNYIGGAGDIAIMNGDPRAISTPERHQGFLKAVAERPDVRLIETVAGDFQREPAREVARELLRRQPKIDAMLVANDAMASGIIDAMQEAGRSFPIVSINGTPDAFAAMKAGTLLATAYFNTLAFGKLSVEAAARYLRGEGVPREILLPANIIDRGNFERWDLPYQDRPVPRWEEAIAYGIGPLTRR